jgi:hypothetical protein
MNPTVIHHPNGPEDVMLGGKVVLPTDENHDWFFGHIGEYGEPVGEPRDPGEHVNA